MKTSKKNIMTPEEIRKNQYNLRRYEERKRMEKASNWANRKLKGRGNKFLVYCSDEALKSRYGNLPAGTYYVVAEGHKFARYSGEFYKRSEVLEKMGYVLTWQDYHWAICVTAEETED